MYFYVLLAACIAVLDRNHSIFGLVVLMTSIFMLSRLELGLGDRLSWVNLTYMIGDPIILDFLAGAIYGRIYESTVALRPRASLTSTMTLMAIVVFVGSYCVLTGPRLLTSGLPAFVILVLATLCD